MEKRFQITSQPSFPHGLPSDSKAAVTLFEQSRNLVRQRLLRGMALAAVAPLLLGVQQLAGGHVCDLEVASEATVAMELDLDVITEFV
jgi:hypothetical protein